MIYTIWNLDFLPFMYTQKLCGSFITSFLFSLMIGRWFIPFSKNYFASRVREHTPCDHKKKDFTPTMGGVFILFSILATILLWVDCTQISMLSFLFVLIGYGMLGAWDDWCKISKTKGISARAKSVFQIIIASIAILFWMMHDSGATVLYVPFFGAIDLGYAFILWALFIVVGCSNAVNLTDGLDGLAAGCLSINYATFAMVIGMMGLQHQALFALCMTALACMGAIMGFLWYNRHPAKIFMGDIGSLSLGGALAVIALFSKQEFLLAITGVVFVFETLSVIIQVFSFRVFKKRVFKMAPLHHHFELLGWHETSIVYLFCGITFVVSIGILFTQFLWVKL